MRLNTLPLAIATGAALVEASNGTAKNFIYVVPDGYGIASQVLARDYYSLVNGEGTAERPNSARIGVDSMIIGSVRTYASDNLVTDSAASGTAFACGIKTYNGAIGVDDNGEPVGSVLEAAHLSGLRTGLVVTSRITHATPASYSAHVLDRDSENEIAGQQIGYTHPLGSVVNLLIGGGRRHYLPTSKGGSRSDDVDLIEWATSEGFTYAGDKGDFDDAIVDGKLPLPFLGLFGSSHLTYELDRNPEEEHSLITHVEVALDTLREDEEKDGFFLMVEASRVDHAAHDNDGASHVHETLMFNEVMAFLKEYVTDHPDTQLLSAADHECGGLTLEDNYNPSVLTQAQHSSEYLVKQFDAATGDKAAFLKDTLIPFYGLSNVTDEDIEVFLGIQAEEGTFAMSTAIVQAFAAEAGINWSTTGHSAADVQLHGFAAGNAIDAMRRELSGNQNNIILPTYVQKTLGLPKTLKDATDALRKDGVDWVEKRDMLHIIKREANLAALKHNHDH